MPIRGHFVCLVCSFRYDGLATLALAASGNARALRARCRPVGPAIALKRGGGGVIPPLQTQGGCVNDEVLQTLK